MLSPSHPNGRNSGHWFVGVMCITTVTGYVDCWGCDRWQACRRKRGRINWLILHFVCRRWRIWNWCCTYCARRWLDCCTVIRDRMGTNQFRMSETCSSASLTYGTPQLCRECWNVSESFQRIFSWVKSNDVSPLRCTNSPHRTGHRAKGNVQQLVQGAHVFLGKHIDHNAHSCMCILSDKTNKSMQSYCWKCSRQQINTANPQLIFLYYYLFATQIVFSTVYATIVFLLTEQPLEIDRFARFTFVYILVTIAADAFGLLLGAIANPIVSVCANEKKKKKKEWKEKNNDRLSEWDVLCRRHHRLQTSVLRIFGAVEPHSVLDATVHIPLDTQLRLGGAGAGPVRPKS